MADGENAATEYTIGWQPQKGPQTALLACPVFEVFFGGARGGGKTDGMLGEWASHAALHGKNAVGLMIRRERVQLLETIERSRQLYGPIGARYSDQDKMWRWPNGARLRFAYLERDADADAYQGHSYTRVYVEELGTFPSASPVLRLMATLRSGEGVPCGFRATGNPGGPGHQWVKARYIDPNPAGWEIRKFTYENPWTRETIEQDRVFIPSKLQDNKFLGPEYIANLQMVGSDTLVRAWLEGDWTVIEGAYFDCWRYDLHVVEPFAVPAHWGRFRSMDWGSAKPFSVGWWAIVGDDYAACGGRILPRGALVRYREWYGAAGPNVGLKMTAEAVGAGIAQRESRDPALRYGVLDPACFKEDGGPSIAERINKELIAARLRPFHAADNARVPQRGSMGGWDQVRSRLVGQDGRPMIYCFSNQADSIRTIPALQHDPARPEDVNTESEDHCFAAGTLVETDRGPVSIEKLPIEGRVFSVGGLADYRSARMTRRSVKVVRLTFDDGRVVICTPDHGFLTNNGWCEAQDLEGKLCQPAQAPRQNAGTDNPPPMAVGVEEAGFADVYCLTVPTQGCFVIEGGLIASNCGDEWRYACMSRPFVRVPLARTRSGPDVGYAPFRSAVPDDWKLY